MKQLFRLLTLALLLSVGVFGSQADSVFFRISDPAAVKMYLKVQENEKELTVKSGINEVSYVADEFTTVSIVANEGYRITSAKANGNYRDLDVTLSGSTVSQWLTAEMNGNSYTISTQNLELARTSSFTVKVVDDFTPGQLIFMRGTGGYDVAITENPQVVTFNPYNESNIQIHRDDWKAICQIHQNGALIESIAEIYKFTAADGDVIEVMANYPDIQVPLSIKYPEGMKELIYKVEVDQVEVEDWDRPDFTVKAGSDVYITIDNMSDKYCYDGVKINGVQQNMFGSIFTKVSIDPMEIRIVAHAYKINRVTLNVDDPARYTFSLGQWADKPVELTGNTTVVEISDFDPTLRFDINSDYKIVSVTDGNGLDVPYQPYMKAIQVKGNMVLNFRSEEKPFDSAFVVYLNTIDGLNSHVCQNSDDRKLVDLVAGYNVFKFVSTTPGSYFFQTTALDPENHCTVYVDDELEDTSYMPYSYSWGGEPVDERVVKIFFGEEPQKHDVSVTVDEEVEDLVKIVSDKVMTRYDYEQFTLHEGSHVGIRPLEDAAVVVTVDGEPIDMDEDGTYNLTVAGPHDINVAKGEVNGIASIEKEIAAGTVYNLLGVKVNAEVKTLPAGIYVINGKKVSVK